MMPQRGLCLYKEHRSQGHTCLHDLVTMVTWALAVLFLMLICTVLLLCVILIYFEWLLSNVHLFRVGTIISNVPFAKVTSMSNPHLLRVVSIKCLLV